MWTNTVIEAFLFALATVAIFVFWMKMQSITGWFYLNPLVLSIVSIISLLLLVDVDYPRYMNGGKYIDYLMEPAVVALGYPLYKQLHMIRQYWRALGVICASSVVFVLTVSTLLASVFDLEHWLIASLVTLNITTPIAMETSAQMGGEPALAACFVLVAGFTGCTIGLHLLKLLGLNEDRSAGLAVGAVSHALGTASIARASYASAAYASTALILCAIMTAIIAPILVPFLLRVFSAS